MAGMASSDFQKHGTWKLAKSLEAENFPVEALHLLEAVHP